MSEAQATIVIMELFAIFWILVGMWLGIGRAP